MPFAGDVRLSAKGDLYSHTTALCEPFFRPTVEYPNAESSMLGYYCRHANEIKYIDVFLRRIFNTKELDFKGLRPDRVAKKPNRHLNSRR